MPFDLYIARHPALAAFQPKEKFLNDEGHHYFYELTPTEIIWWDEGHASGTSRQTVL